MASSGLRFRARHEAMPLDHSLRTESHPYLHQTVSFAPAGAAGSARGGRTPVQSHEGLRGCDESSSGLPRECYVTGWRSRCHPTRALRLRSSSKLTCQAGNLGSAARDGAGPGMGLLPQIWIDGRSSSLSGRRESREPGKVGQVLHRGNYALASFGPTVQDAQALQVVEPVGESKSDLGKTLCAMMPYIVVAAAITALTYPPSFTWFQKQHYPTALGGIMLSIGVQLSLSDFEMVFKQPQSVATGMILQYAIKPALCMLTIALFRVPPQFAAGLILTACVSGAQLASYATSLAGGSVALSVVLTSLTTIGSVVATPALSKLLIGAVIPVDTVAMAKSIMQVVILPIAVGLFLNAKARPLVNKAKPILPLLAITCTTLCIGSPLAFNQRILVSWQGLALVLPVLFFHIACTAAGYWMAKLLPGLRNDENVARTLALNGAMQSSTLAMLLASQFLGGSHPVPPSCSVVIMAVLGLGLGSFWGKGQCLRDTAVRMVEGWKEDFPGVPVLSLALRVKH